MLLITSRDTGRWVIPKGWPWLNLSDHLSAAEEAWEEAGVRGSLDLKILGTFTYQKQRPGGPVPIEVVVYRLDVDDIAETWPEAHERKRAWFAIDAAAAAITEPELRHLILALAA